MSRPSANKVYKTFVGGLITEASPLTYPENASIDEDNTVITRRGNRRRRLGIDYIDDHTLFECGLDQAEARSSAIQEFFWTNVANNNALKFLVLQVGASLYFYDVSDGARYPERKSFTVNLNNFRLSTAPISAAQIPVSMAAGRGSLFVTGEYFDPFYVDYSAITDTITAARITILIRDFVGVDDGLAVGEEPTVLSKAHEYNLYNQGWINPSQDNTGTAVTSYDSFGGVRTRNQLSSYVGIYNSVLSRFPSNAQVWWGGKDSNGAFSATELAKQFFGNTRAPRGHYVVEAFNIDRTAVSGLAGVPGKVSKTRPKSVGFFSGRVWWGHDNDVYFSQVLEDRRQAGNCYQEADPTSEYLSDLIESDGGQIPIPEAVEIERLVPFGDGILVFAANGVWNIRGTDAGFTARDYAVSKVSSIGLDSPQSVVEAGSSIFWWSKIGIQAIKQNEGMFGPVSNSFNTSNITETIIQSFYNDEVSPSSRLRVKGRYDPTNNTVQWLFKNDDAPGDYFYNRILNFDMTLEAFYPWTLAKSEDAGPFLCGSYISQAINETRRNRLTRYIALIPNPGGTYCVAFCEFKSFNFTDWDQFDPAAYESYLITGYELLDDAMRNKELSHIHTYFNKTETMFVDEGDGDYSVDRPSSCKFQVRWDWADSAASGKWTREVEAYRHRRLPPVNTANLAFDNGSAVVISKNRIRGHGRAIQFKFSSDKVGHDFDLLGWAAHYTGNANV